MYVTRVLRRVLQYNYMTKEEHSNIYIYLCMIPRYCSYVHKRKVIIGMYVSTYPYKRKFQKRKVEIFRKHPSSN